MDNLHAMLSRIRTEAKSSDKAGAKPLDVFREFLAHLEQIQSRAQAAPERAPAPPRRRVKRRVKAA
jgi:hypothetical protein